MENPRLGILGLANPRKRKSGKRGKKMARKRRQPAGLRRYWAKHRHKTRGRKNTPKRRRRVYRKHRKNWISPGMVVAANPRRRHHRKHHVRHRRHRYSRNPRLLGFEFPAIKTVIFAGVGFAGPSFVQGFLTQMVPAVMQQATSLGLPGKYLVKIGSILGLSWITRRFIGSSESHAVLVGGGVNVAISLVNDFAPGFLPANPLSMYVATRPGLQAYVPVRPGLRAIPGAAKAGMATTAIPTPAPFRKLHTSGPFGSASRYQRY